MTYVYKYKCYEDCPITTAPDLNTLTCVGCGPNCDRCGTNEGPSCYECAKPYLLEAGLCKVKCEIEGNRPNSDKTQCVAKTKFPVFGPLFTIMSLVIVVVCAIVKFLKRETNFITSLIGLISPVESIAIIMNMVVSIYDE